MRRIEKRTAKHTVHLRGDMTALRIWVLHEAAAHADIDERDRERIAALGDEAERSRVAIRLHVPCESYVRGIGQIAPDQQGLVVLVDGEPTAQNLGPLAEDPM